MQRPRIVLIPILCFLASALPQFAKGKGKGGDDEGRIAYEMAASLLLAGESEKAKARLKEAAGGGGRYADLARLELVRIVAKDAKTPNRPAAVKQILAAVEDEAMKPRITFAAAAALYGAGEFDGSLEIALDLSLRLPADPLASDAVLLCAQIYLDRGQVAAALERALFLTNQYPKSGHRSRAYQLIASIYSLPGTEYSPIRAMRAQELAQEASKPALAEPSSTAPH